MKLRLLSERFAVLKLVPPQPFPAWLGTASLFFVAQTEEEYSVMCPEHVIPARISYQGGYRCLRVDGDLAFDEVGVVARVSRPLAEKGLSLFLISTYDRDYVLVGELDLLNALDAYDDAGFVIIR